ncbi:FtsH protease activity modulator HflK [Desulfosarcina sp. OttesenSCG-928-A07]|nr:FtsH protease activity modulator HflK [Desulfosarcina sp. OttesenSCG-928-G17]MDL2328714.1 FtsH protease activity modulator HflK [Desulfosarcina sp. OttesenSCG-928-A07]
MSWDWEKLSRQHEQQKQQQQGGVPPQMEDIFNQLKKMKPPGGSVFILLGIVVLLMFYSSWFTVESGAVGVIQRFGKFVRVSDPGLNFKLPFGIEKVTKVHQDQVNKEEFGLRDEVGGLQQTSDAANVSLMLTGDLNVAVVPWIVQYRIKDPYNYLFKVRNPVGLLRDLSESSMRLVVGDRSINEVISKRDEIAAEAKTVLQKELDKLETGIHINTVEMKQTNVPEPVQPSFNEVNQATQEKEKMIYQSREDYNKAIPAARGEAERTIKAAEGYALDRINRAKGDAARFQSVYAEYVKAKDVTRRRLYLEALQELLPKIDKKYLMDADQKNLLPLLNLGNMGGELKNE